LSAGLDVRAGVALREAVLSAVGFLAELAVANDEDSLFGAAITVTLASSSKAKDQMESGFLLDVIVGEGSSVLELLSGEDESLLVWGNAFLVLDLLLNVFDGVGTLNVESNGLAREGLNEDLHSSSEAEHQVESGFLLDVVVRKGSAVLELLSSEDESLLVWWDAFLVLDLLLDVLDGVGTFNVEGNGLASESLNEDLHGC